LLYSAKKKKTSQVSGANPETLEREKKKHLEGQDTGSHTHPEHAPGWNEQLAVSFFPSFSVVVFDVFVDPELSVGMLDLGS
jgi:hypothetical protein